MVFEVKESARNFMNYIGGNPFIVSFIKNPFYTAILITVILILVIIFVFRNAEIGGSESLTILALRTGVYSLLLITGIQFLQNQYVINEFNGANREKVLETVFDTKDINKMMHEKVGGGRVDTADNSYVIAAPTAKSMGEFSNSGFGASGVSNGVKIDFLN